MSHVFLALLIQLALSPFGWWFGAASAIAYYLGREMSQAEYRVIQAFYNGRRSKMPWYGAFERRAWNTKSLLDIALPVIAVIFVALIFS
jgi:hypothetical protein